MKANGIPVGISSSHPENSVQYALGKTAALYALFHTVTQKGDDKVGTHCPQRFGFAVAKCNSQ